MNKNIAKSNAATGTTTAKQERYEKKMAKYAANKARREQMENEKMKNSKQNESATSELEEIEKQLVKKAKDFYENYKTFIHFPVVYKGKLNMISAVSWGWDDEHYYTNSITIDGTDERNELDELWERVLDRELDNFCIKLLQKGGRLRKRYIKANTPGEAFDKACAENKVSFLWNQPEDYCFVGNTRII